MLKREDSVCTIGYDGNTALVDRSSRKAFGAWSVDQLLQAGQYRAAAAAAMQAGHENEAEKVAAEYNRACGSHYTADAIPRLFGVAKVSINRTLPL